MQKYKTLPKLKRGEGGSIFASLCKLHNILKNVLFELYLRKHLFGYLNDVILILIEPTNLAVPATDAIAILSNLLISGKAMA